MRGRRGQSKQIAGRSFFLRAGLGGLAQQLLRVGGDLRFEVAEVLVAGADELLDRRTERGARRGDLMGSALLFTSPVLDDNSGLPTDSLFPPDHGGVPILDGRRHRSAGDRRVAGFLAGLRGAWR